MATYYLSPISLIIQYFTNLGVMAQGAQLYTYVAGTVSTPATTYTDSTGLVANPNPMTLNAAGRPASSSGAPVALWAPAGTILKLLVTDAGGNQLVLLDNIGGLNDTTTQTNSLQTLLASPASSNASGAGPVAGVDLVANAVKSYDVFADVRAANEPVLVGAQTLNIEVQGGSAINDGLGGFFYWSGASTATDDARTVLKPNTAGASGRWLRYYPLGVPQVYAQINDLSVVSNVDFVASSLVAALIPGTYEVSIRALLLGAGATAQGYKIALAFGGTLNGAVPNIGSVVSSANGTVTTAAIAVAGQVAAAAISDSTGDFANIDITVAVSAAGAFSVQFAQDSSAANASLFKAGSAMTITRVA